MTTTAMATVTTTMTAITVTTMVGFGCHGEVVAVVVDMGKVKALGGGGDFVPKIPQKSHYIQYLSNLFSPLHGEYAFLPLRGGYPHIPPVPMSGSSGSRSTSSSSSSESDSESDSESSSSSSQTHEKVKKCRPPKKGSYH
jgi:hypothetical protein